MNLSCRTVKHPTEQQLEELDRLEAAIAITELGTTCEPAGSGTCTAARSLASARILDRVQHSTRMDLVQGGIPLFQGALELDRPSLSSCQTGTHSGLHLNKLEFVNENEIAIKTEPVQMDCAQKPIKLESDSNGTDEIETRCGAQNLSFGANRHLRLNSQPDMTDGTGGKFIRSCLSNGTEQAPQDYSKSGHGNKPLFVASRPSITRDNIRNNSLLANCSNNFDASSEDQDEVCDLSINRSTHALPTCPRKPAMDGTPRCSDSSVGVPAGYAHQADPSEQFQHSENICRLARGSGGWRLPVNSDGSSFVLPVTDGVRFPLVEVRLDKMRSTATDQLTLDNSSVPMPELSPIFMPIFIGSPIIGVNSDFYFPSSGDGIRSRVVPLSNSKPAGLNGRNELSFNHTGPFEAHQNSSQDQTIRQLSDPVKVEKVLDYRKSPVLPKVEERSCVGTYGALGTLKSFYESCSKSEIIGQTPFAHKTTGQSKRNKKRLSVLSTGRQRVNGGTIISANNNSENGERQFSNSFDDDPRFVRNAEENRNTNRELTSSSCESEMKSRPDEAGTTKVDKQNKSERRGTAGGECDRVIAGGGCHAHETIKQLNFANDCCNRDDGANRDAWEGNPGEDTKARNQIPSGRDPNTIRRSDGVMVSTSPMPTINSLPLKKRKLVEAERNLPFPDPADENESSNSNSPLNFVKNGACSPDLRISEVQQHPAFKPDEDGDLPLHIAVVQGSLPTVCSLLHVMTRHAVSVDCYNNLRQTPLHLSVIIGQLEMVRMLLEAGASPNSTDRKGQNSIHLAVLHKRSDCLQSLLNSSRVPVDVDTMNYEGLTALHLAALCGFLEGVQMLLSAGANIDSADGKNGRTALYLAVDGNDLTMAKLLLDRGANMEHMTYSGCLPIHAAISRSNMEMVKLLEEYCSGDAIENVLRRDKQHVSHGSSQLYSNSKTKDSIKHQRQGRIKKPQS